VITHRLNIRQHSTDDKFIPVLKNPVKLFFELIVIVLDVLLEFFENKCLNISKNTIQIAV
jgi:hypothetical protein